MCERWPKVKSSGQKWTIAWTSLGKRREAEALELDPSVSGLDNWKSLAKRNKAMPLKCSHSLFERRSASRPYFVFLTWQYLRSVENDRITFFRVLPEGDLCFAALAVK